MCNNKFISSVWIFVISTMTQGLSEKSTNSLEVTCGHADKLFQRCFSGNDANSNATKFFLQQQKKRMPLTSSEIDENCKFFNRGIQCYEEYVEKCMDFMNKRVIVGETEPAKSFYYLLCRDEKFKENFLAHRECLRYIEKDWEECTRHYQHIIESEFKRPEREERSNINVQHMHFCCARQSYKKCIFNSAMSKCNIRSANFARDLVDLLSNERQFKNCVEIEKTSLCSGGNDSFRIHKRGLTQFGTLTLIILVAIMEILSAI